MTIQDYIRRIDQLTFTDERKRVKPKDYRMEQNKITTALWTKPYTNDRRVYVNGPDLTANKVKMYFTLTTAGMDLRIYCERPELMGQLPYTQGYAKAWQWANHFIGVDEIKEIEKTLINGIEPVKTDFIELKDAYMVVSRAAGKKLGLLAGLSTHHCAFNVFKIKGEKKYSLLLEVQATGKPTKACACCGLTLSDETSIKLGIGPICRRERKVLDWQALDQVLKETTKVIEVWVGKDKIKERVNF